MVTSSHQKDLLPHFGACLIHILVYYESSFDILPKISNLKTIQVPNIHFWIYFQNNVIRENNLALFCHP